LTAARRVERLSCSIKEMKTISTDRPCGKHKGVELLKLIKYDKFQWKICADLKVVGMVCGLQGGYTKNC